MVFTQSYGPEARGGACAAQVIIADDPIDYPVFDLADSLVAMSQEACVKYVPTALPDAIILLDSGLVTSDMHGDRIHRAPFTRIAEDLGNRIVANIVMLGCFAGVTQIVDRAALEEAIRTEVRPRFVDLNLEAFARGWACAAVPEAVS